MEQSTRAYSQSIKKIQIPFLTKAKPTSQRICILCLFFSVYICFSKVVVNYFSIMMMVMMMMVVMMMGKRTYTIGGGGRRGKRTYAYDGEGGSNFAILVRTY